MATTKSQEKASKKYYDTHPKYRKKVNESKVEDERKHPSKYAKKSKEYYHSNEEYKKYKKNYAKTYRKREPEKSKAVKYRVNQGK